MKICFHVPSLQCGGAEKVVLRTANYLAIAGHEVMLLVGIARGPLLEFVSPRVAVLELGALRTLTSFPALVKTLRSAEADVFVSSLSATNVASVAAHWVASSPARLVLWEHSNLSASAQRLKDKLIRVAALRLYHRADAVIAVSKGVAEDLIASAHLPTQRVKAIHNPIEINTDEDETAPHPWLSVSRNWKVVISIGRLEPVKNYPILLEAMARLPEDVRLIILGEGSQRSLLEARCRELGLRHRVALPGYVPNPQSWLKGANAFALSSNYEGFGNVLVEALAAGLPVVATDCASGPSEILLDGCYGELVRVGDAVAISSGLLRALESVPDRNRLLARAREFAAESVLPKLAAIITGTSS